MAPCVTPGVQMLAARPCISSFQSVLTARARISPALGVSTFATCPRISYSRPSPGSSRCGDVAVRAVSGESTSQGLPIDLRGKQQRQQIVALVEIMFGTCMHMYF